MSKKTREENEDTLVKLCVFLITLPITSFLFQYVLWNTTNIDVAWYWDVVGGMFFTNYIAPISFFVWLLILYGVNTHFIG